MFLLVNNFKMIGYAIERCARSGSKKLTKTYHKGFPNYSTLINYGYNKEYGSVVVSDVCS